MLNIEGKCGSITLADQVIARVVGWEAGSCYGVVGMAAKNAKDNFTALLKTDNMDKGVEVSYADGEINIQLHIVITQGVNIPAISQAIEERVCYGVEKFTGIKVRSVTIFVDSFKA